MPKILKHIEWKGTVGDTVKFSNKGKIIVVKVRCAEGAEFSFTITKNKFTEFLKQ